MTQLVTAENILGAYRAYCSSMKYTSQRNTIKVVFSIETFYRCFSATVMMLENRLTDNAEPILKTTNETGTKCSNNTEAAIARFPNKTSHLKQNS